MGSDGERSFEELALPHLEIVYRVAARLTGNDHDAEDLVQETYLKAHKAFPRFEMREFGIRPWLLKILNNTFLNRVTRENRAPRATDQQTLDQVHGDEITQVLAPPKLDFEHLDAEVKQAIDGLALEFRTVMLLWATGDLSYQEIADILDVPIGTVMSRLHRARQQLMRELSDYASEQRLNVGKEK